VLGTGGKVNASWMGERDVEDVVRQIGLIPDLRIIKNVP
jgi:hypothetical protein